ncbi:Cadherin [Trinorchestia longiramus]|nr:Cadherin [Trinorchestia longiramus]
MFFLISSLFLIKANVVSYSWIAVSIRDENDHNPVWDAPLYEGFVLEISSVGDPIMKNPESNLTQSSYQNSVASEFVNSIPWSTNRPHLLKNTDYGTRVSSDSKHAYQTKSDTSSHVGNLVRTTSQFDANDKTSIGPEPLAVGASDADAGANSRVAYSIAKNSAAARFFSVDSVTGALRVDGNLSALAGRVVRFYVWVSDLGTPRREALNPTVVQIYVEKVNKFAPKFDKSFFDTQIQLPTIPGVKVTCLSAHDPDDYRGRYQEMKSKLHKHRPTTLRFSLSPLGHENSFVLDESGCLFIANTAVLKKNYNLSVEVSDGLFSSSSFMIVSVLEPTKTSLIFSREEYHANVLENSTKQVDLLVVRVQNLPLNHEVHYSILNPNDFLTIRRTSGVIQTTGKPFDREEAARFSVLVQARDVETDLVGNTVVIVSLLDVNDNEPVFMSQPYHAFVPLAAKKGHVVAKVRAVDADSGEFGRIRYELVRGSGELFRVDRNSGEVVLRQPLVTPDTLLGLTVAAYDGGTPPLSSQAHVSLRVVTSEGPEFDSPIYQADVPEDAPPGTAISRVFAEGKTSGPLVYVITQGDPQHLFALDYATGILHTSAPLDYEAMTWHNLTVRARDPVTGGYADALVTVRVLDVNDNPPVFVDVALRTTVSEAAVLGTIVIRVPARDPDTGPGGLLKYSCLDGCNDGHFSVLAAEGAVTVARKLDCDEDHSERIIKIAVTDSGLKPLTATTSVTIAIKDFNDNAPVWWNDGFEAVVTPEADAGLVIAALSATDPDSSDLTKLRYHISGGDAEHVFALQEDTGVLSVTSPEKLISGTSLALNVTASDGIHAVETSVSVTVLPSNAHSPRFSQSRFEGTVPENAAPGTPVLRLAARDHDYDTFGRLSFAVQDDMLSKVFSLDADGTLYTEVPLDRESRSSYLLVVSATDGGGKRDYCRVLVHVQDRNDNPPVFSLPDYQADVLDSAELGRVILKLNALDLDTGINSEITYQLYKVAASDAKNLFRLDTSSGELSLMRSLKGLAGEVFQFFVRATDRGNPPHHTDVPVTAIIHTSAATLPSCPRTFAQFFLAEDAAKGTVVTSLWVHGPLLVKYTLVETALSSSLGDTAQLLADDKDTASAVEQQFAVTPSGHVILQGRLDREARKMHTLVVLNSSLTAPPAVHQMTLSLVVMDVNDNTPRFSSSSYSVSIPENSALGSTVMLLSATDRDEGVNGQIQYNFSSHTSSTVRKIFQVSPLSGAVVLIAPLDRESVQQYSFSVTATDGGTEALSSSCSVKITVTDINDNPPVFQRDIYRTSVSEGADIGHTVLSLSTSDADELRSDLCFFITAGDPDINFRIKATGEVMVQRKLDRERKAQYRLSVTATDGRSSTNTTVSINVLDVNDNGPVCHGPSSLLTVSEDVSVGTPVTSISAWDADTGFYSRTRFALSGTGHFHFAIDKLTGQVTTARSLDRETQNLFFLTAQASDWEHSEWLCSVDITISVTDVNDNPPEFQLHQYSVTVPEDFPVSSAVARVIATDRDLGRSREVLYSMPDTEEGRFSVDSSQGLVMLGLPLDREQRDRFTLTIWAHDRGEPPLSASAKVVITVADVNDNPPEFVLRIQHVVVAENAAVGTEVARVTATSRDVGANAQITYSLSADAGGGHLAVHPKTGVISIAEMLDYEETEALLATVKATDGGDPPLTSTCLLNLTILDINDNAPTFAQNSYFASVPETAFLGSLVLKVSAQDPDRGKNGEVRYSISKGDPTDRFALNAKTGELSVASPIDREQGFEYLLQVTASDAGSPALFTTVSVFLNILDDNDNPPVFDKSSYSAVVQEDRQIGASVIRLAVEDADGENNSSPFTFEIQEETFSDSVSGDVESVFGIEQDGTIVLIRVGSHMKIGKWFFLKVRAWDSGTPPLHGDASVNISVVEESKHPPALHPLKVSIFSYKSAYRGGIIGKVSAVDKDPYDKLFYSLALTTLPESNEEYFDIDEQDGTLVMSSYLDDGIYTINVSVTDGKFTRYGDVTVVVQVVTESMINSAVILKLGSITTSEFFSKYRNLLVKTIAAEIFENESRIHVVGVQVMELSKVPSTKRGKQPTIQNIEILLIVRKGPHSFYTREEIIRALEGQRKRIQRKLSLETFKIMQPACKTKYKCNNQGQCHEEIIMKDDVVLPLNSKIISIVAPRFEHKGVCRCNQGYDGVYCQNLVNACGHKPCREFEICSPTESIEQGYVCHCPKGFVGEMCHIDAKSCNDLSCFYPQQPLSFSGRSYIQYVIEDQQHAHALQMSLYIKSRQPSGTISYAQGDIDYSLLEVKGGIVQYRWECGSGEGIVRASNVRVDDNKWHLINLTRDGTVAVLSVDNGKSSSIAPGENDVLNMNVDHLYFGAQVTEEKTSINIDYGFVGCIDQLILNGHELPLTLNSSTTEHPPFLKKLVAVEFSCPANLPRPGPCGTYPCLNQGTCMEINHREYRCSCPHPFSSKHCQKNLNPCLSNPCLNGGVCFVAGNTFECNCSEGLSGHRCSYGAYCNPNPCENGGRCEDGREGPLCRCSHFTGSRCEEDVDECSVQPCANGGTCINLFGDFRCLCLPNFNGKYCSSSILNDTQFDFIISLRDVVVLLAILVTFSLVVVFLAAWQRKRWRKNRQRQNSRHKHSDHVKNDLTSIEKPPSRNTKICNVEADQMGMSCRSFTRGEDSTLLHSLKQWTDMAPSLQDTLELDIISRHANDFVSGDIDTPHRHSPPFSTANFGSPSGGSNSGERATAGLPEGLSGHRCSYGAYCNPNPCENGGRCEDGREGPLCRCSHFTGSRCEEDVDECSVQPCANGGTCINLFGDFRCLCLPNFNGKYCSSSILNDTQFDFSISLRDVVVLLAILVTFSLVVVFLAAWQRKRWRKNRQRQNSRHKHSDHVKNDLTSIEKPPSRNTKICNVEADQMGMSCRSFTRGEDSTLLHSLKQWTDMAPSLQDTLELDIISRHANDFVSGDIDTPHRHSPPFSTANFGSPSGRSNSGERATAGLPGCLFVALVGSPGARRKSSPRMQRGLCRDQELRGGPGAKPWSHHNNLKDTYFTLRKQSCVNASGVSETASPCDTTPMARGGRSMGTMIRYKKLVQGARRELLWQADETLLNNSLHNQQEHKANNIKISAKIHRDECETSDIEICKHSNAATEVGSHFQNSRSPEFKLSSYKENTFKEQKNYASYLLRPPDIRSTYTNARSEFCQQHTTFFTATGVQPSFSPEKGNSGIQSKLILDNTSIKRNVDFNITKKSLDIEKKFERKSNFKENDEQNPSEIFAAKYSKRFDFSYEDLPEILMKNRKGILLRDLEIEAADDLDYSALTSHETQGSIFVDAPTTSSPEPTFDPAIDYGMRAQTPLLTFGGSASALNLSGRSASSAALGLAGRDRWLAYADGVQNDSSGTETGGSSSGPADTSEAMGNSSSDDTQSGRPQLADASRKLPEVVLCSYDSSQIKLLRDSSSESSQGRGKESKKTSKDIVKSVRFSTTQDVATIDCSRRYGSLVEINVEKSSALTDSWRDTPGCLNPTALAHLPNGTLPLARAERATKSKAVKVAPVDVAKLGQPRSREPIMCENISRISDLSFDHGEIDSMKLEP